MDRDINGVTNYLFDQLEATDKSELEFEQKIKLADIILKNIWKGASVNLQYKRMMLRAPEIAKDKNIVLELGNNG